ncbi:cilia- and flagella-associated protein 43 [Nematolebias whitei]|uniref:cilia- and flagella-associated protein 43 n=1 Tax=Nematolebias whitei TaxID=451745 RepID=UPI0018994DA3|nr:cilia- and flagella-associated protein 43 [Nematolebias whitei]
MNTFARIKSVNDEKVDNALQHSHFRAQALKEVFDSENPVLVNFRVWDEGSTKTEDSEVKVKALIDPTKQDEQIGVSLSAPSSDLTWLETKAEEAVKDDNKQHSEEKKRLRETVAEIRHTSVYSLGVWIQKMLRENNAVHLKPFDIDVEEQRRLEDMVEQEAERERAETEQSIAEMCYLQGVLRERWDSWMVKSRAIKAFYSEPIVQNYPLSERAQNELEDLRRVQNMRKLDEAARTPSSAKNGSRAEDQKKEEEGRKAESAALKGSFSAQLGFSNPYIYDQFSLQTIEQRINQTVLLQDVIYSIKMAFNTEFEARHRQKLQELRRVGTRNKRIREIMQELDVNRELWESGLMDSEWPERLLTVDDSEIQAEKYLTPEEEEERKKMEETYLAAKGDDSREKALDDMMDGALQVQKVDILKMEIPVPEFVLTKPDNHWSEEEKNVYKEFEKKTKELNEEKDKYKRSLEIEMRNLQKFSKEGTEKFDETLTKLMEKKVEHTAAIYQEELMIIYLADSVLTEEEMRNSELELKLQLENLLANKHGAREEVVRQEHEVELFQEAYKDLVSADKALDGVFRKEFSDVPTPIVDHLYKLFKRRPRVQMMRAQTGKTSEFKEHRLHGSLVLDALNEVLKGMEELDSLTCMPEGLDLSIWDRMCLLRRAKVESEQQVQMKALTLAEMQAFLQKRNDEVKAAQQEITNCSEVLKSLHKERNDHLINTRVQVVQKQGQVEMLSPVLSVGSMSTNFLCHKSMVDKLRGQSMGLEEEEIYTMRKNENALKKIMQLEWKQSVLENEIQDLKEKTDIKMLQLSNQQQDIGIHQQKVQQCQKRIDQMKQQEVNKTNSCESFEQQLPELQVTVAELTSICGLAATEENLAAEREERYQEILQRKTWKETAISHADELFFLSEEVERLKKKNYISLDELEHHN